MNMAVLAKSNKFITIAITMASLKPVFFFLLFSFLYNPSTTEATDPIFLRENCTTNDTFTANSAFQLNLRTLLTSLSSNATGPTEFFNTTIADKNPADTVYGLFMCRGDVPSDLCRECVVNATQRLGGRSSDTCPFSKGAIIWYDECMIRYSNRNFFSTMDTMPRMRLRNTVNVTDAEKERFMKLLYTTLNETADEAAKAPVGMKKYATKEANMSAFQTLYTLTQCTPDLTPQDCRRCLAKVIADVPWCCTYRVGGRVLYPSCNFRYEFYPFFRNSTAEVPSGQVSPAAKQRGKKGTSSGTIIAIVVPITVAVLLFVAGLCFLSKRARKKYDSAREGKAVNDMSHMTNVEELQFDFHRIEEATNNFSVDNKLGEGGFGEVYKGTLPSGQVIAVKRLSKSSGQGAQEFKNEVVLVAKLEHRNLVRLLGFCVQGQEKLLIYEFVPNKSLDFVVFNPERQKELDWTRRYKIIGGIARGILYLHEESRLRIIHRDLKASNVLLDADMNPKISDFGMARLFGVDQTQGNTSRIVGTYGYMSPEYAMHGQYSVKSDVYSFGVLLIEIINGKKNSSFCQTDGAEDLLSYAWKLWKDGSPLELLDPTLRESCAPNEVVRCIHIGLLCVQEDPEDRPTMATIILMLDSYTVTLPAPKQPAFFIHSQTDPNMPKDLMYGQSTSKSITASVNEMSVSEFLPR